MKARLDGATVDGYPQSPECIAANFLVGANVNGQFPAPRAPDTITSFAPSLIGTQFTASWMANTDPNDTVTVTVGHFIPTGNLFGQDLTPSRNQLSGRTTATNTPYTFPASESAWVLQYPMPYSALMTLTIVTDQVFPPATPLVDFTLVRTYNSVTTSAFVNYTATNCRDISSSPGAQMMQFPP